MKHPDLIQKLSLEQKVALLSGRDIWSTYPIPALGIPSMYLSDGPHGVRKQVGASDHLGQNPSRPATCFPTAAGAANSWDPDLVQEMGRAIGEEAACQQVNVLLGPGLNTKRSPLGGRNFEYYSEDPYLSGKLAAAFIRGVQENGIAACPKHFAANSQELLRMSSDSVVDMRALRELYLTNFEIAVKEGQPKSLMSSYNRLNGTYSNDNPWLLTQVLREEWGFDGFVVTDWGGSNDHAAGIRAGSALEMPGTCGDSDREVLSALREGALTLEDIDRRVDELLEGVLSTQNAARAGLRDFDREGHHALARRAAAQTAVLLKNQGGILPLAPGTRVAVIGDLALEPRYQGAGSSLVNPTRLDRPIDALRDSGLDITAQARGYRRDGKPDQALAQAAAAAANKADVVLLYLGLPEISESEGMDRSRLGLPDNQTALLAAVSAVNPNVVVVLSGGGAVEMPWLDRCRGLLHGYLAGQAGAGAMADLLTGKVNPSGRLAESFPFVLEDSPNHRYFPGRQRTAEYRESIFVGYRYYETVNKPVCFPFGYGLSYTTFSYGQLSVDRDKAVFTLTNTGDRAGAETAQLYISLPGSKIFRPARELKGFSKVALAPGESRRVTIPLDDKAFRYFNVKTGSWEVEGGRYEILVGSSVSDIRLSGFLEVTGTDAPLPYDRERLPAYFSGRVEDVDDGQFETLLSRPIPPSRWDTSAPLAWNDTLSQLSYAKNPLARAAGRLLTGRMENSIRRGKPDLNVLFICNMPFRSIAKMSGGLATDETARSILVLVNGRFFRGLGGVLGGFFRGRRRAKKRRTGI